LIGFSAYVFLLNARVRPALLTSYAYVNPVVAVLLGRVVADEQLGLPGVFGMAIVVLSVVLSVVLAVRSAGRR
jgi:drug/metabolite transporter (DMT)-like permease